MFFLGLVILGLVAAWRIPVELFPNLSGEELSVSFFRPRSEPEILEREILLPLEARVSTLPKVAETWGEVRGSGGNLRIRFDSGTDMKVRELELQQVAAELARSQPRGSSLSVSARDTSLLSSFVMILQAVGGTDRNALFDFVDEHVAPRLEAVSGVSRVMTIGGAGQQVTVWIDPDRCAAVATTPEAAIGALRRSVSRLRFLGGLEDADRRTAVILDGRPRGLVSLGEIRIDPGRPVLLRHVAEIERGTGRERFLFRTNSKPSVGLVVFQDQGTNLVRLGRTLRSVLEDLRAEMNPVGVDLLISFDGAELVEEQIRRLALLGFSGFVIALLVLYLFLRQWRAVTVVALAVPVSLLVAVALLEMGGQTVNLITLFGLAVGIGLLVDNSVVVFEATQRSLERGLAPDDAAAAGVRRTIRAIVAASVTTAVVFLPLVLADFEEALIRSLVEIVALAILLPLAGSLLVAVGLVPLLARWLAAPAAVRRLAEARRRRAELGGLTPPDRVRGLFTGLVTAALRRPAGWIATVVAAVVVTVIVALPWVLVKSASQAATEADQVQMSIRLPSSRSLQAATEVFAHLEQAVLALEGIERVESTIQEGTADAAGGTLTAFLVDRDERPEDLSAARVRQVVRTSARSLQNVEVLLPGEADGGGGGGGGGDGGVSSLLGQGASEVVISGPDSVLLAELGREISDRLASIPEVASAWVSQSRGQEELHVVPDASALAGFGLTADQVLPILQLVGREGQEMPVGFTLADSRELPLMVRRPQEKTSPAELARLRLATPAGVLPLAAVASVRTMPPASAITHHNGRRELSVFYRLDEDIASTGPERLALEEQIAAVVRDVHRPRGTTVEADPGEESISWFKRLLVPAILLLFLVLATTFESLTLPVLVLLALPLTILGSLWSLVLADIPLDLFALVGALALLGLTVNPAILLVDRMQQRLRVTASGAAGAYGAGAAALAAVRERARPVFMTTATTVAGLWPLALQTGRENEIWPPFATVVMGGLVTSTALTLLVIPVGFVFLARLDRLFGRLGPWVMIGWVTATAAVMVPLVRAELVTTLTWQVVTTLLVAAVLLGAAALVLYRPELPEPATAGGSPPGGSPPGGSPPGGPPALSVRNLRKVYGRPGPVGQAWRAPEAFARKVLAAGGRAFDPRTARDRLVALGLVASGNVYLALHVRSLFWEVVFLMAAATVGARFAVEVRRARGRSDTVGRVEPGGAEGAVAFMVPWIAWTWFAYRHYLLLRVSDADPDVGPFGLGCLAAAIAVVQLGRRTARLLARGTIAERVTEGRTRYVRTAWRRLARRFFGLDLPREEIRALTGVSFDVESGMVGVLGPNGAGKTTLLRQLAGILDPTAGRILLGGVHLDLLRRYLARWVGYLPQDTALPPGLTAREYLDYYALLYEIPATERRERIGRLLTEVGLAERADEKIGSYSGGMRQRVAVARTLLRLPPVIIVDEPTVGLDPRERIRFRNLLSRLAEGRVVLFSTHVVEDVAVACERVIVLARGSLVFDGPPHELADAARGQIWEVALTNAEIGALPSTARIADQVPEAGGRSRLRLISSESPHDEAQPVEPSLEEGYLMLVGERGLSPWGDQGGETL